MLWCVFSIGLTEFCTLLARNAEKDEYITGVANGLVKLGLRCMIVIGAEVSLFNPEFFLKTRPYGLNVTPREEGP